MNITIEQSPQTRVHDQDIQSVAFGSVMSDHMFVAEYADGGWQTAKIVPYQNLSLSPATTCLHYGQAIFEGLKAQRNDAGDILVFRPWANAARLNASATRMQMAQVPEALFMDGLTALLRMDQSWVPSGAEASLYIRPFLLATDPFLGIRAATKFMFIIVVGPVGAYYSKPVRVRIETHYTRAVAGGVGFAKTAGNYAAAIYPTVLAQQQGYDQLIWTDGKHHSHVEESGTMNVMFVINNTLITAPLSDTILPGITRDSVLTLAREWGVPVEERPLSVTELMEALQQGTLQEAFGVGTAATIAHIQTIGHEGTDYVLPDVANRPLSMRLRTALDQIKTGKLADTHGWIYKL